MILKTKQGLPSRKHYLEKILIRSKSQKKYLSGTKTGKNDFAVPKLNGTTNLFYLDHVSFRKISRALQTIKKDSILRSIFQIAICHGRLALPDQTMPLPEKKKPVTNKKIYFSSSESDMELPTPSKPKSPEPVINRPNENEILQAFKEQIGSLKMLTFASLSRIEQRLCEKFQVTHFQELNHGSFMNYIQQNEQLLFSVDTKFNLSLSECTNTSPTVVVPFDDLEQFILQALARSSNQEHIEQIINYHFQIESFQQLGYGSFRSVFDSIKQNKKPNNTSIHYECIMLDEIPLPKQKSKSFLEGNRNTFHSLDL